MVKKNCGCRVRHIGSLSSIGHEIMECPTHAAAFEMREALALKANVMIYDGDTLRGVPFQGEWVAIPLKSFLGLRKALALAEGKEADHGKPASS